MVPLSLRTPNLPSVTRKKFDNYFVININMVASQQFLSGQRIEKRVQKII